MEAFIQISKLNDFLYSPKSLYFHSVYEDFDTRVYQDAPQQLGKFSHETIDDDLYSGKRFLKGMSIASEEFGLVGKIDIYDTKTGTLIERKRKIKKIHKGYWFQILAEFVCLVEEGFEINALYFHSLSDNKRYPVSRPTETDLIELKDLVDKIQRFNVYDAAHKWSDVGTVDDNCIYKELYF